MQQGFMHQYGHYAWGIDYYDKTIPHNAPARFVVYDWHRNEQPIQEEGYTTDLIAAEAERLPLGDKPLLMEPPLPYVYGMDENKNPPEWLKESVNRIRATQPKQWAPGETPWPQAPKAPVGSL